MEGQSIVVYTNKNTEFLTKLNGSCSWLLNPERARNCDYVVCTFNANHELADDSVLPGYGFLIGKISNVTESLNPFDEGRWMIEFEEYMRIDEPDIWQMVSEGNRYPVRYVNTYSLASLFENFDLINDESEWERVPPRDHEYIQAEFDAQNLYYNRKIPKRKNKRKNISITEAISDAKKGLSEQLDVLEENIEIIIKG